MHPRIFKSGSFIHLIFQDDGSRTHSIALPIDEKGLSALLRILTEREISVNRKHYIATTGAPIQHMIREWLRKNQVKVISKREAPEDLTFDDLDI
jgi:hypothetical protein